MSPKDVFQFDESKLKKVSIDDFRPNTWNPKRKDNKEYEKVLESVKVNGLTQPIFVRQNDRGGYVMRFLMASIDIVLLKS